jgi:hypothetical protein
VTVLRLPDFLIGGAPRSGTSWLSTALDRHPAVYLAKPARPEPKFFLVDSLYAKGLEYYARTWFADVPDGRVAGEKSTDYLESAEAADRIARDLPHARLIFVLRDPVERAHSNYRWTRMNGLEHEDFETALRLEEDRERTLPERLKFARPYAYFSRGLYAELLQPYLDRIDRSRILVLKFEDIAERPSELLTRVHAFLGVASRSGDAADLGVVLPSDRLDGDAMPPHVRADLRARYQKSNDRLRRLLGPGFESWD